MFYSYRIGGRYTYFPTFVSHPTIYPEEPALPPFCLLCLEVAGLGWSPGVAIASCVASASTVAWVPHCK